MQNKFVVEIQSHDIISLIDPTLSDGHLCSCVDSFTVQMISNAILVLNVFCRYRYKLNKMRFCNNQRAQYANAYAMDKLFIWCI